MASNTKTCLVAVLLVFMLASAAFIPAVDAAGECGKTPIKTAAVSLSPCLSAAGKSNAKVPPTCCTKVGALIKTAPKCLCAVLLSPLTKQAGINPAIAITIPKRCNISNRPSGKKCGSKYIAFLLRIKINYCFSKIISQIGLIWGNGYKSSPGCIWAKLNYISPKGQWLSKRPIF